MKRLTREEVREKIVRNAMEGLRLMPSSDWRLMLARMNHMFATCAFLDSLEDEAFPIADGPGKVTVDIGVQMDFAFEPEERGDD